MASGKPREMPPLNDVGERLQKLLDAFVAKDVVGASLAVGRPGEAMLRLASGFAERENRVPMSSNHLFRVASCTKMFTAALLLRLVQNGQLELDEPIVRWFPDLPKGDRIFVRQLLNHRSGLPDYEQDFPELSDKKWKPRELVDLALRAGTQAEPGGDFAYTNTGLILAGMIVEAEGGERLSHRIREQLFEPFGLTESWCGTDETPPEERRARANFHTGIGILDSTNWFDPSGMGAAGDIVSTPGDLVLWLEALFGGKVLDDARFEEMAANLCPAALAGTPLIEAGHGLLVFKYDEIVVKGHLGQIRGFVTMAAHDESNGINVSLATNSGARDVLSPHMTTIHDALGKVLHALRA